MKTLVVYYSFTGKTEQIAKSIHRSLGADVVEIREITNRSRFCTITLGVWRAKKRKGSAVFPLDVNLSDYDIIIVATPVWAGAPAPAVYNFIREYALENKTVYGLICYKSDPKNASKILKEEMEKMNIRCKAIISVQSNEVTMKALKNREVFFDIDSDGKIFLETVQKKHQILDENSALKENQFDLPKKEKKLIPEEILRQEPELDFSYNRRLRKRSLSHNQENGDQTLKM